MTDHAPDLNDAVAGVKAFLAGWNHGDVIDQDTGMSADDLAVVNTFVNEARPSG